jgi:hypothetical protein
MADTERAGGGPSISRKSRLRWFYAVASVALFAAGVGLHHLVAADDESAAEPTPELESTGATDLLTRPEDAPRDALAAARREHTTASELTMIEVAAADRGIELVVDTGAGEASAALALEGDLITSSEAGKVELWRRADGALLGEVAAPAPIVAFADAEFSTPFVAALNREGALELVDISDPSRPRILPLGRRLAAGEEPLAVAFSKVDAREVVAIGSGGELLRVDDTTKAIVSNTSLSEVHGIVPWIRGGAVTLTAARFVPEVYEDEEGLLVGTAEGGVADVDIGRGQGKTVVEPGVVPGRILSLDRVSEGDDEVVVGSTGGLTVKAEEDYGQGPPPYPGPPVPAVAIPPDGEGRWVGNATGLLEPEMEGVTASGPPVRAFDVGPHGIVAIDPEGKVSVLGDPGVGISMEPAESTSAAAFDPHGDLLIASGYDPNHTERIRLVRPLPRLPGGEYQTEEGEIRAYEPDPLWWGAAEDPEAFYVNSVAGDDEYVAAGGQDPEGNAVVAVWDAASGKPLQDLVLGIGGVSTEAPTLVSKVMLLPGRHQIAAYSVAQQLLAVWSTETWELEESIPVAAPGDLAVSPDESTIAVVGLGDEEGVRVEEQPIPISFVDLEEGKVDHTVEVKGATAAAYSPDGSSLAVAYGEDELQLRSPDGHEALGKPIELTGAAKEIAWRPTGGLLAVSLVYGGVAFVDPSDGTVSRQLPYEAERPTLALSWSPDGEMLATQTAVLDEEDEHYDAAATEIWTLGAAALQRRMCELAGCEPEAEGAAGQALEDVAALRSIDFVYRDGGDLYAGDATGATARIGELAELPNPMPAYDWSLAGFAWSGPGQLSAIVPGDDRPRTWPCACAGVAWDDGGLLSVATDGTALVHVDPGTGALNATPIHGLPQFSPFLLGVIGGRPILTAYGRSPDRSTFGQLFELEPDGTAVRLARNAGGPLAYVAPSSSADKLALVSYLSGGACYTSDKVAVVTARPVGKDTVEVPPPPLDVEFPQVRSVQVAADGTVAVAAAPISCNAHHLSMTRDRLAVREELVGGEWRSNAETGFDVQTVGDETATVMPGRKLGDPGPLELRIGERVVEIDPAAGDLVAAP